MGRRAARILDISAAGLSLVGWGLEGGSTGDLAWSLGWRRLSQDEGWGDSQEGEGGENNLIRGT